MKTSALLISIALGAGLVSTAYAEIVTPALDVDQKAKLAKKGIAEPAPVLRPLKPAPSPVVTSPSTVLKPTVMTPLPPVVIAPKDVVPPVLVAPPALATMAPPVVMAPTLAIKLPPPIVVASPPVFTPPVVAVNTLNNLVSNAGVNKTVLVKGSIPEVQPETIVKTITTGIDGKVQETTVKTVGTSTPQTTVIIHPASTDFSALLGSTSGGSTAGTVAATPVGTVLGTSVIKTAPIANGSVPTQVSSKNTVIIGTTPAVIKETTSTIPAKGILASDRRLKTNIQRIGTHRLGIGIYEFDYFSGEHAVGVMADEVKTVMPNAVIRGEDGYDRVDYSKLN